MHKCTPYNMSIRLYIQLALGMMIVCMSQDANRLIRQSDEYAQYADILVPVFRTLQSYRLGNLVESYQTFEKAAKYVYLIWNMFSLEVYLLIPRLQCFHSGIS